MGHSTAIGTAESVSWDSFECDFPKWARSAKKSRAMAMEITSVATEKGQKSPSSGS